MTHREKIWPLDWASLLESLAHHELELTYLQIGRLLERIMFGDEYGIVHVYQFDQGCCGLCVVVYEDYLADEVLQVFAEARRSKYFAEMQLNVAVITQGSKASAQKAESK